MHAISPDLGCAIRATEISRVRLNSPDLRAQTTFRRISALKTDVVWRAEFWRLGFYIWRSGRFV
eukprot:4588652-Pyramimonas_sp.AAC.1